MQKEMVTLADETDGDAPKPECKDAVWGLLLAAAVVAEIFLAVAYGIPAINNSGGDVVPSSTGQGLSTGALAGILVACVAIAAIVSILSMCCVTRCAESLVRVTVFASIALNVVLAVASLFLSFGLSILWLILAALGICFWCSIRDRIPFAAAHLEIAGTAVRAHSMTLCWAYVSVALAAAYALVWAVATIGVFTSFAASREAASTASDSQQQPGAVESVVYVLQILALYWGTNFVRFSLHVVVSGTVGTWWAVRDPKDPTVGSIKRAWTTSCGSVSLAALLIAIIQTIRHLVRQAQRQAMQRGGMAAACCLAMLHCLLRCIEDIARYISSYALVRVALFGEGFIEAGRATFNMFRERGWDAVLNDIIIERTMMLLSFLVGALAGLVAAGIGYLATPGLAPDARGTAVLVAGLCGLVLGVACSSIVSVVVDSGVKTIFVAFAEQPDGLRNHHPELFRKLLEAWAAFYPEELAASGYADRYHVGNPAGNAGP